MDLKVKKLDSFDTFLIKGEISNLMELERLFISKPHLFVRFRGMTSTRTEGVYQVYLVAPQASLDAVEMHINEFVNSH